MKLFKHLSTTTNRHGMQGKGPTIHHQNKITFHPPNQRQRAKAKGAKGRKGKGEGGRVAGEGAGKGEGVVWCVAGGRQGAYKVCVCVCGGIRGKGRKCGKWWHGGRVSNSENAHISKLPKMPKSKPRQQVCPAPHTHFFKR